MPTSIQQNTLTICKISYGEAKKAVLHFANGRKSPRDLTGDKFYKYKDYVKKPIEDENWCEWIEIRIPNLLLKVKKLCVFGIKVTEVFYVYEAIWHGRARIPNKTWKKSKFLTVKGFAGTRAIVYDRNIFSPLPCSLLHRDNITSEVIGHVSKHI